MTIVGMNYSKILAEKKGAARGKVSINSNVKITDVNKANLTMGSTKQDVLRLVFEFTVAYEPKVAQLTLIGDVLDLQKDSKVVEKIDAEWKKKKQIPKDIRAPILNHILSKCNVQAILLSKEMNLPPPVPMPKVVEKK